MSEVGFGTGLHSGECRAESLAVAREMTQLGKILCKHGFTPKFPNIWEDMFFCFILHTDFAVVCSSSSCCWCYKPCSWQAACAFVREGRRGLHLDEDGLREITQLHLYFSLHTLTYIAYNNSVSTLRWVLRQVYRVGLWQWCKFEMIPGLVRWNCRCGAVLHRGEQLHLSQTGD